MPMISEKITGKASTLTRVVLCLSIGSGGLAGCAPSTPKPPFPPKVVEQQAYSCAPERGWLAGRGQARERPACLAESSGLYRQAFRLGQEWRAIQTQLQQGGLTGAERSRLLQERETLENIARLRGWAEMEEWAER